MMELKMSEVKLIWNISIRRGSNFTFAHARVTRSKRKWEMWHNYSCLLAVFKLCFQTSPPYFSNYEPGLLSSVMMKTIAPKQTLDFPRLSWFFFSTVLLPLMISLQELKRRDQANECGDCSAEITAAFVQWPGGWQSPSLSTLPHCVQNTSDSMDQHPIKSP